MKIDSLRMGNLIKATDTPDIIEVFHLDTDSDDRNRINYIGSNNFIPIELTNEWIKKLGFDKEMVLGLSIDISIHEDQYRKLILSDVYLYLREGILSSNRGNDDLVVLWNKDIRKQFYVHELQNIYFMITGKELTIK